jgi:hypothetical protein
VEAVGLARHATTAAIASENDKRRRTRKS